MSTAAPVNRKVWAKPTSGVVTSRQEQVLKLKREGLSNKDIGKWLGIAEQTVKAHVQNAGRRVNQPRLSARQKQIAREAIAGLTNKEIGAKLGIVDKTVSMHLMAIFTILGIRNRRHLHKAWDIVRVQ